MNIEQHGEEQAVDREDAVGREPDVGGSGGTRGNRHLAAYRLAASHRVEKVFPMLKDSARVCPTFSDRLLFNGWVKQQMERRNMKPISCPSLNQ